MEIPLVPDNTRLALIIVVHPDKSVRIAIARHIDPVCEFFGLRVVHEDPTLTVTGSPHFLAVG